MSPHLTVSLYTVTVIPLICVYVLLITSWKKQWTDEFIHNIHIFIDLSSPLSPFPPKLIKFNFIFIMDCACGIENRKIGIYALVVTYTILLVFQNFL